MSTSTLTLTFTRTPDASVVAGLKMMIAMGGFTNALAEEVVQGMTQMRATISLSVDCICEEHKQGRCRVSGDPWDCIHSAICCSDYQDEAQEAFLPTFQPLLDAAFGVGAAVRLIPGDRDEDVRLLNVDGWMTAHVANDIISHVDEWYKMMGDHPDHLLRVYALDGLLLVNSTSLVHHAWYALTPAA